MLNGERAAAPLHEQMKSTLCALVPMVAGGGQGGSPRGTGHSSVHLARRSPGHPHLGSCDSVSHRSSGKVPISLWRGQGRRGEAFSLPRLGTSPVVPPSVSCREVGSSREIGWADPSLPLALAAVPRFPHLPISRATATSCSYSYRPGPAPFPKESPKSLVPGTKGSRTDRLEPGSWLLPHSSGVLGPAQPFPERVLEYQGLWKSQRFPRLLE